MKRIVFFLFLFLTQLSQSQETEALVANIIELRGQVEDLQAELQILKAEHKNSMSYLNTRKAELTANVDRKQLQIKQAKKELENLQGKIKELGMGSEEMKPEVEAMISQIKLNLNTGIPFKQVERLSVVEEIERGLNAGKLTSQSAINRLWAYLEDELRLTRENAIYSQTINLNGENILVDVAKLGTAMMFFKTRDDKYGKVVRGQTSWNYQLVEDDAQSQQIALLFESLKKQIRQGYFVLPLDLVAGETK